MNTSINATAVATINNQEIVILNDGEKRVAIKPICEALGLNYGSQLEKLKSDEILSSTVLLRGTVGADGRQREMATIPFKYVFGWLFTINPKNVAESARESLIKYQIECYDALWNHFSQFAEFVQFKNELVEKRLSVYKDIKEAFSTARNRLKETESDLDEARKLTLEQYLFEKRQLAIPFPEDSENVKNEEDV